METESLLCRAGEEKSPKHTGCISADMDVLWTFLAVNVRAELSG